MPGPAANSCFGCHSAPDGAGGGGGDIVANVFVLGQRFDFATFDHTDIVPQRGCMDEAGQPVTLQSIASSRATLGMFGSGFIEMLARQMTADLLALRDTLPATGGSVVLVAKGVSFGILTRNFDGSWDVPQVTGLGAGSLSTFGGHAYDTVLLLQAAIPEALKKAKPGTPEFRAALRDALEGVKNLNATHGVFNMSGQDHNGLDQRARVIVTIDNGDWKLVK